MAPANTKHDHRAAIAVWSLGVAYAAHFLCVWIALPWKGGDSGFNMAMGVLIPVTVLTFLGFAGNAVYRVGRLIGAVLLSCLLLGGHGVSGALALKQFGSDHKLFVTIQAMGALWAIATVALLALAQKRRDEAGRRNKQVGERDAGN
jgi:hypothetical protein